MVSPRLLAVHCYARSSVPRHFRQGLVHPSMMNNVVCAAHSLAVQLLTLAGAAQWRCSCFRSLLLQQVLQGSQARCLCMCFHMAHTRQAAYLASCRGAKGFLHSPSCMPAYWGTADVWFSAGNSGYILPVDSACIVRTLLHGLAFVADSGSDQQQH